VGTLHGSHYIAALTCAWHHRLIKCYGDVWPKRLLDFDRPFWREEVLAPVEVAVESRPLFTDAHKWTEGDHLKATRICEDRFTPRREAIEAAETLNSLVSRSKIEVVRIRQDDLRANRM